MSLLKLFFTEKCTNCGHRIEKAAKFCNHCQAGRANSWRNCTGCGASVAADSTGCWSCGANLTTQARDLIFSDRWRRTEGIFATRVTIETPQERLRHGIQVDEGTLGILYRKGQYRDTMKPGYHSQTMIGFCGGAQILALLTSMSERAEDVSESELGILDGVLLRNDNTPIRGRLDHPDPYERTFWFDPPSLDAKRPALVFHPRDPLFAGFARLEGEPRRESREIASSHGDMLRVSAFERGPLGSFQLAATSTFCRAWVRSDGPERTFEDPAREGLRCVTVPQAFRSRGEGRFPIIGFQFHPEQRDLQRLAPGSPREARGDALNVLANAVDLALEGYLSYWADR